MSEEKDKTNSVSEQFKASFGGKKIFLWGEVSDRSARDLTEKLLFLKAKILVKKLHSTLILRADQSSGMAIFDTMQLYLLQLL